MKLYRLASKPVADGSEVFAGNPIFVVDSDATDLSEPTAVLLGDLFADAKHLLAAWLTRLRAVLVIVS